MDKFPSDCSFSVNYIVIWSSIIEMFLIETLEDVMVTMQIESNISHMFNFYIISHQIICCQFFSQALNHEVKQMGKQVLHLKPCYIFYMFNSLNSKVNPDLNPLRKTSAVCEGV